MSPSPTILSQRTLSPRAEVGPTAQPASVRELAIAEVKRDFPHNQLKPEADKL